MLGLIAVALGLLTVALTGRVSETSTSLAPRVSIEQRGPLQRVVLVFVDSLTLDVATDAERMPELARLAREGASFDVEPCRDQLTYLCLRAALTGRDESSLLGLVDNFRPSHQGPSDTLFSAIRAQNQRVSVIGSADFHPYRSALFAERTLARNDETPQGVLGLLRAAEADDARLIVVSLSRADMVAHAHGVASEAYTEAFERVDRIVASIAESIDGQTQLVVFGDHGHDALGRHLPGTRANTWAVYHGPAFRRGQRSSIRITDHRALLGVLLGVPTEALYRGPPLTSVFREDWLKATLSGQVPALAAPQARSSGTPLRRWAALAAVSALGVLSAGLWLARAERRNALVGLAALGTLSALCIGLGYDAIRFLVHDHGDSPGRGLSLLVPLAVGCMIACVGRRAHWFGRGFANTAWVSTATACVLGVTFLLMLPTSYYYGARRALVLASILALATLLLRHVRINRERAGAQLAPALALAFAAAVLASLYPVRQLGPETAGDSLFALDSSIYKHFAWLPLIVSKLVIFLLLIAPRAARRPLDVAGAAGLLSASVLVELARAELPRPAYACLFGALVLGSLCARHRAPSSLFAAALLLLDHLYAADASHLAPLEMVLAATAAALFAWRRMRPTARSEEMLGAITAVVAVYLMLWPTVGFHIAGLDFSFMFQWVPAAKYDQLWWVIALGMVVKMALPLILVVAVAREHLRGRFAGAVVCVAFAAKGTLLSVMIAAYATIHVMGSQQATSMLAELVLVVFALCCLLVALPSTQRIVEPECADAAVRVQRAPA